jgi:LPPG:FO 2-phospho-L-lactate transferase
VTRQICEQLGVKQTVLPMTESPVRTFVEVAGAGRLPFQSYLVQRRGRGRVRHIRFAGLRHARPAPGVLSALRRAGHVIVPPSNPLVSIGPILALPGVRRTLRCSGARVAAVSPIVAGAPVKGPLHRMLRGLGHEVSPVGVARLYRGLVHTFVLDHRDRSLAPQIADLGMQPVVADTMMTSAARSRRLAAAVLAALDA